MSDAVVSPPSVFDAGDLVDAVTDLCSRAGVHEVEIGYTLRSGAAGVADWYAVTGYAGSLVSERGHPSPAAACYALACRVVAGMRCGCSLRVALDPGEGHPELIRPWARGEKWGVEEARRAGWCLWQPYMKRWRAPCEMLPGGGPELVAGEAGMGAAALLP